MSILAPPLLALSIVSAPAQDAVSSVDWPCVGNDRGCMRYSELARIDRANVKRLTRAWTWHTGELERGGKTIECTPLVVTGRMYVTTAYLRVACLDATTGAELWTFDPFGEGVPNPGYPIASGGVNRGLAYWRDGEDERILHGAADGRLFSLVV